MAEYKFEVTGDMLLAHTFDKIYVTLIGTEGKSKRTNLDAPGFDFKNRKTQIYTVTTEESLGHLLLVKVEKEQLLSFLPESKWFCSKIVVTTPDGDVILFPCHRIVTMGELVELRGGKATRAFEDELPRLIDHRQKELELNRQLYQWIVYAEGLPHMNSTKEVTALPEEAQLSVSKTFQVALTKAFISLELRMKGYEESTEKWKNFEEMKKVFWFKKTTISEYVSEHWKEDEFYGYQFLNGANPNVIQCCSMLPDNFPVTEEMVQPFLEEESSLAAELLKGNIFLCDYKRLEGLTTRVVNGEPLPLTAALCLFYKTPQNKLLPIAIQLGQKPSEQNPMFLPSDSEHDWLLAKIFVRNADFMEHQFSYHLLNTHFLAEVFAMATLRNLPAVHPLYKLLIPHFRNTLQINVIGHERLFGPEGKLINETPLGIEGMIELMRRTHAETTYSALCLPDNIAARGLESVPNFYYRDDGLKLWNIINGFVKAVVEHYYTSDSDVSKDTELQAWIKEIFTRGFQEKNSSGFPQILEKVEDVVKFTTMVIFTVSAQHAAVNHGQFDYCGWMPNSPSLLCKAPPTGKGSTMDTILQTLPDVGTTARIMALLWLLAKRYSDFVPLGSYPDEYFDDPVPKQLIRKLQVDLTFLTTVITERNSDLELPYDYMNPSEMENSVAI